MEIVWAKAHVGSNPTPSVLVGSQDDSTVVRRIPVGFGAWLSPVERCVRVAEVPGSNPGAPMDGCGWYGGHGSTRRGAGVGRTGPPRKRCVGNHTGVRIPPPPLLDRPSSSDHDMRSLGDLALPGLLSLMPSGFSPGARRQALGERPAFSSVGRSVARSAAQSTARSCGRTMSMTVPDPRRRPTHDG